jgi:hypothetical protein
MVRQITREYLRAPDGGEGRAGGPTIPRFPEGG